MTLSTEAQLSDLLGRLADDAALSRQRSIECRRIGNITGMQIASQIADDLDEAGYMLRRVQAFGARQAYDAFMNYVRQCNAAQNSPTFIGAGDAIRTSFERPEKQASVMLPAAPDPSASKEGE